MSVVVSSEPLVQLSYPLISDVEEDAILDYSARSLIHRDLIREALENHTISSREAQVLDEINRELSWTVSRIDHFAAYVDTGMGTEIRLRFRRNYRGQLISLKTFYDIDGAGREFIEVRCRSVPAKRVANDLFFQCCQHHLPLWR